MKLLSGRLLAVLFLIAPQLLAMLRSLGFIAFELLIQKLRQALKWVNERAESLQATTLQTMKTTSPAASAQS